MKRFKKLTIFSRIVFFICIAIFITSLVLLCLSGQMKMSRENISRLIFILCQSILMSVLILLPLFFRRLTHLVIPTSIEIVYVVFCSMCLILGEMAEFYDKIFWWDSLLHTLSGVLLGIFGYILINTIDKSPHNSIHLTPFFSSCLILMFVMAAGYLWEIFEWYSDELFGSNMQRYLEEGGTTLGQGTPLVGHAALGDTMKDLQLNLLGGLLIAIHGYIEMKRKKNGITNMALLTVEETKASEVAKLEEEAKKVEALESLEAKEDNSQNN